MPVKIEESRAAVEKWNNNYAVGQRVVVTRDFGEQTFTRTRSGAYVAYSGHAVIFVEGITGWYLLERVKEGYPKAKAQEVKDSIVTEYCDNCRMSTDDDCPDEDCPASKAISLLYEIEVKG